MLALYALVLQGFLGGLMPPAGPGGVHCAPVAAGEHPDRTSHDHAACCVAAHVLASALPSRDGAVALGQPRPPAAAIAWTMSTGFSPRAPPHTRPHPRGPPAA